jgi:Predicted membrane protein
VSDTNVRTNQIRRIVIGQSLLAYLFGAVIIGTVVNLVLDLG